MKRKVAYVIESKCALCSNPVRWFAGVKQWLHISRPGLELVAPIDRCPVKRHVRPIAAPTVTVRSC